MARTRLAKKTDQSDDEALARHRAMLEIDPNDLVVECSDQPNFIEKVGRHYANAVDLRDAQAEKVKVTAARRFDEIRDELAKEADGKAPTVKAIEAAIAHDPVIQDEKKELRDRNKAVTMWDVLRESARARGHMLTDLVKLHLTQHYATQDPETSYEEIREIHAEARRRRRAEGR